MRSTRSTGPSTSSSISVTDTDPITSRATRVSVPSSIEIPAKFRLLEPANASAGPIVDSSVHEATHEAQAGPIHVDRADLVVDESRSESDRADVILTKLGGQR